jgi:hypothetical protein
METENVLLLHFIAHQSRLHSFNPYNFLSFSQMTHFAWFTFLTHLIAYNILPHQRLECKSDAAAENGYE